MENKNEKKFEKEYFNKIIERVDEEYNKYKVYPAKNTIFCRAYIIRRAATDITI